MKGVCLKGVGFLLGDDRIDGGDFMTSSARQMPALGTPSIHLTAYCQIIFFTGPACVSAASPRITELLKVKNGMVRVPFSEPETPRRQEFDTKYIPREFYWCLRLCFVIFCV